MKLAPGPTLYDPDDPVGKLFFKILSAFAELFPVSRPTFYRTLNRRHFP